MEMGSRQTVLEVFIFIIVSCAVELCNMCLCQTDAAHSDGTHGREVEYSDIDFSVLKRNDPAKAQETPEATEYAQVNTGAIARRRREGEYGEMYEEQEATELQQTEAEQCIVGKEDEYEEMTLYSNVHKMKQQA